MPEQLTKYHPYQDLPSILYLLGQMTISGSFIGLFLVTYLTFDDHLFSIRYATYLSALKWLLLSGIILLILHLVFSRQKKVFTGMSRPEERTVKNFVTIIYCFFLILLSAVIILHPFGFHPHFLNLLLFMVITAFLWIFARNYEYPPQRPAWNHPTTGGGIVQGAIVIGLAVDLWIFREPTLQTSLGRWMFILLIIEILTLWSRFRFLSRSNLHTRASLKIILGSHLILFGIRFIFGLIMPLAYILWVLLISPALPLQPVIMMVLVGEISERLLFFVSSPPVNDLDTEMVTKDNLSFQ